MQLRLQVIPQQLARLIGRERRKLSHVPETMALGLLDRCQESGRALHGTRCEHQQHGGVQAAVQEPAHEVKGGLVGPVEVIERHHQRAGAGERFKQRAERAQQALSAVRRRDTERGKQRGDQGALGIAQLKLLRSKRSKAGLERINHHGEGQTRLELRRARR